MELSAKFLAQLLKGTVEGDENAKASGFAKIEHGKPGTLSFFANPKYEPFVYTSKASILIVGKDFQPKEPVTPTLVRVDDAYTSIAELLKYVADKKKKAKSHRSLRARWFLSTKFGKKVYLGDYSYVGRHTVVGDNTVIHEHVYIGENCKIGTGCIFYPGVRIYPGMVIGNNVILHSGVVIGADGFGNAPQPDGSWEKIEHLGNVVIGNDVEIGANTTVDRAQMESTIIGNGVKIDNLCQIAHNVIIGEQPWQHSAALLVLPKSANTASLPVRLELPAISRSRTTPPYAPREALSAIYVRREKSLWAHLLSPLSST